jgi:ubiquinone/menaquinone biosynthesis C-methylase UbiE
VNFLDTIRTAYDTVAEDYHSLVQDSLATMPFDRAMTDAFASLISGPVLDVGCGPGHRTAYLQGLGLDSFGIDLSPEMISVARQKYPDLRFSVGSMLDLDLPDASVGGVLSSYSIIHLPPSEVPVALAEFYRVLAPGGYVLVAFHVGDIVRHLTQGYGHSISLDVHWLQPDKVAAQLEETGFTMVARLVRAHELPDKPEQAVLIARKP